MSRQDGVQPLPAREAVRQIEGKPVRQQPVQRRAQAVEIRAGLDIVGVLDLLVVSEHSCHRKGWFSQGLGYPVGFSPVLARADGPWTAGKPPVATSNPLRTWQECSDTTEVPRMPRMERAGPRVSDSGFPQSGYTSTAP